MIQALKKAAYAHGYLFITAAWLYTISFVFTNYWSYSSSPKSVQTALQAQIAVREKEFNEIAGNRNIIAQLISPDENETRGRLIKEELGLFVYRVNNFGIAQLYWNTNAMAPSADDLQKNDGSYYVNYQNGSFELVKKSVTYGSSKYFFVAMIPVQWKYFTNNKYLEIGFAGFPEIENLYRISETNNGLPVKNSSGQTLFRIEKKEGVSADQPNALSITLRVLAIIFLLVFINSIANDLVSAIGFLKALIFLLVVVFGFRFLTYEFPFPFDFRNLELFYGGLYASSSLNPSLGDLLINSILIFWMVTFTKFNYKNNFFANTSFSPQAKNITAICGLFLLAWFTLSAAGIIGSIVSDSTLSFDVTNFFGLSIYIFIGLAIISFIILSFFHFSHLLLLPAKNAGMNIFFQISIVAASGLFLLSFNIGSDTVQFKVFALAWLAIYIVILRYRSSDTSVRILNSSFFMIWAVFFTASITTLVISQNEEKELQKRYKDAESLAEQIDPAGQGYLKITLSNLSDDFLKSNFDRFYDSYDNKFIKDSLVNEIFSGYLNNYDTHIYTFNYDYQPLYNDDSVSYASLQSTIRVIAKPVDGVDGLYYYENSAGKFSYLYQKNVQIDKNVPRGEFVILLNPKQNKSEALYPELFRKTDETVTEDNSNYAYAVYNNRRLINNINNYSFSDTLLPSQLFKVNYETHTVKGYTELWYNAGNNRIIAIAKKDTWLLQYITFFAYLFCIFIAIVVLLHFGSFILKARFNWANFKKIFVFNIRTQIHATIIFISLFSFIIIGIATISFFITRFDSSNREKLSNSIRIIDAEIEDYMKNSVLPGQSFDLNDENRNNDVEKKLSEISEVHDVDVNFYDLNGNLLVSSQPVIYNNRVLSSKMNAAAYNELHFKKMIQSVSTESIGNNFSYLSIYIPVKNDKGDAIGYLNIPYLNSQSELNQEISNFLVTLINLNALIFLMAGAIALLVTSRITSSFSLIGTKMKEVSLGKLNEEIVWKQDDEIGALINEYNKMVKQLEASARSLARSEREEAWREMARQVAHEIKNPLTPMKLSIQYLQKAIDDGYANVKELSQQVAATLIEQIDQLAKIAGDFSQFANIGNVSPARFDISEVITSLVNLYNAYPDLYITLEKQDTGSYEILSDKTQINRLFTNLIKNAIEASSENRVIEILIRQFKENNNVVISVEDNGTGIPADMQSKIFAPNFTTKSSGTGLGLAICRGIAEKADGKIWFETEMGEGSTFYVSLPLAKF